MSEKQEKTDELNEAEPSAEGADDTKPSYGPLTEDVTEQLTKNIVKAIKTVYDPEIPVDIYELGLIYRVDIEEDRSVSIEMTLTSPGCPVAGEMPEWVEQAVKKVDGVESAQVALSFDPPWDMSMMSEEARFALNMF